MKSLTDILGHLGYWVQKVEPGKKNVWCHQPYWNFIPGGVIAAMRGMTKILDVGCGTNPHPLATHLVDIVPIDDPRWHLGSIEEIPFPDDAFDFVVASHVLEHTRNPEKAGKELARVAAAGYIEVPRYGKDILVGPGKMHRWQIVQHGEVMYFYPYSGGCPYGEPSPVQRIWMDRRYHPWQEFFVDHWREFNIQYLWVNRPKIKVMK